MDNRPIKGGKNGGYNLNFVDWQNEWERIADEGSWEYWEEIDRRNNPDDYRLEDEMVLQQGVDISTFRNCPLNVEYLNRLTKMKVGGTKRQCPICISNFSKGQIIYKLPCNHIMHKDCLQPWLQKVSSCPLCRKDLNDHFKKEDTEN